MKDRQVLNQSFRYNIPRTDVKIYVEESKIKATKTCLNIQTCDAANIRLPFDFRQVPNILGFLRGAFRIFFIKIL